jgi:hypothetical protein
MNRNDISARSERSARRVARNLADAAEHDIRDDPDPWTLVAARMRHVDAVRRHQRRRWVGETLRFAAAVLVFVLAGAALVALLGSRAPDVPAPAGSQPLTTPIATPTAEPRNTQQPRGDDGTIVNVGRTFHLGVEESVNTVVLVNADATIDGRVTDSLTVVNGTAVVNNAVDGDIFVLNGTLDLREGARVGGDVKLLNGSFARSPGAVVEGEVDRNNYRGMLTWDLGSAARIIWFMLTPSLMIVAALVIALARRQIAGAVATLARRPGTTVLAGVVAWVALPLLALLLVVSVLGIPLGVLLALVVLPGLWLGGYVVAATWLGAAILRRTPIGRGQERPYRSAVLGVLVLQFTGWVPVLGALVVLLAGVVGSGGLILPVLRTARAATHPALAPAA